MSEGELAQLFSMITQLIQSQAEVAMKQNEVSSRLDSHMEEEKNTSTRVKSELGAIGEQVKGVAILIKAFPKNESNEPDLQGHHDDHLTRMRQAGVMERRKNNIIDDLVTNLVKGFSYGLMFLVLLGAKDYFNSPAKPTIDSTIHHMEQSK